MLSRNYVDEAPEIKQEAAQSMSLVARCWSALPSASVDTKAMITTFIVMFSRTAAAFQIWFSLEKGITDFFIKDISSDLEGNIYLYTVANIIGFLGFLGAVAVILPTRGPKTFAQFQKAFTPKTEQTRSWWKYLKKRIYVEWWLKQLDIDVRDHLFSAIITFHEHVFAASINNDAEAENDFSDTDYLKQDIKFETRVLPAALLLYTFDKEDDTNKNLKNFHEQRRSRMKDTSRRLLCDLFDFDKPIHLVANHAKTWDLPFAFGLSLHDDTWLYLIEDRENACYLLITKAMKNKMLAAQASLKRENRFVAVEFGGFETFKIQARELNRSYFQNTIRAGDQCHDPICEKVDFRTHSHNSTRIEQAIAATVHTCNDYDLAAPKRVASERKQEGEDPKPIIHKEKVNSIRILSNSFSDAAKRLDAGRSAIYQKLKRMYASINNIDELIEKGNEILLLSSRLNMNFLNQSISAATLPVEHDEDDGEIKQDKAGVERECETESLRTPSNEEADEDEEETTRDLVDEAAQSSITDTSEGGIGNINARRPGTVSPGDSAFFGHKSGSLPAPLEAATPGASDVPPTTRDRQDSFSLVEHEANEGTTCSYIHREAVSIACNTENKPVFLKALREHLLQECFMVAFFPIKIICTLVYGVGQYFGLYQCLLISSEILGLSNEFADSLLATLIILFFAINTTLAYYFFSILPMETNCSNFFGWCMTEAEKLPSKICGKFWELVRIFFGTVAFAMFGFLSAYVLLERKGDSWGIKKFGLVWWLIIISSTVGTAWNTGLTRAVDGLRESGLLSKPHCTHPSVRSNRRNYWLNAFKVACQFDYTGTWAGYAVGQKLFITEIILPCVAPELELTPLDHLLIDSFCIGTTYCGAVLHKFFSILPGIDKITTELNDREEICCLSLGDPVVSTNGCTCFGGNNSPVVDVENPAAAAAETAEL